MPGLVQETDEMVKINKVPPPAPMYYVENLGTTVGHIEKVGREYRFMPTLIFSPQFTSGDLDQISIFWES